MHEIQNGLLAIGVGLRRQGRRLLDHVDLHLAPGRVGVILGPNGAGKSTLLSVLGGLVAPQEGQVTLDGETVAPVRAAALAHRRAFIPQDEVPAFDFLVRDIVIMGRHPHRLYPADDEEGLVMQALGSAAIEHLADRRVRSLSGGERARVQLARALAQVAGPACDDRPRWLMLDEPTAALDLHHQHAVMQLLQTLSRERGIGVLVVLHDLNLALRYADSCWILTAGRLVAAGSPAEVLQPDRVQSVWQVQAQQVAVRNGDVQLLFG